MEKDKNTLIEDPDKKDSEELIKNYYTMMENALKTNFVRIHPYNPIFAAGVDWYGRRIVVINAHCMNSKAKKEDFLSYYILKMNRVV